MLFVSIVSISAIVILSYSPLTVFVQTQIINSYHPIIVKEKKITPKLRKKNNWSTVKLLSFQNLLRESLHHSSRYIGAILIPSLDINLPLANYTDDNIYTFGAGMLEPENINSSNPLVIGAHNLGWKGSSALFTPIAFHRLYGRKVIITNFEEVKEFKITSKKIIAPTNVKEVFKGTKNSLSLLTCTSNNKNRILVRAELTKTYSARSLSSKFKRELSQKYRVNLAN
ncbi:class A sortase [Limosilactobacillus sp. WF-MA3-C]|uniref:Class A sortase n=1 Tax=Limosilactobacillus fastidiosus TaxID=2759855 RepID=A0A7W3U090_9LACO|nr:class A sortase [Limosilactobacillus fastidiosus]